MSKKMRHDRKLSAKNFWLYIHIKIKRTRLLEDLPVKYSYKNINLKNLL
jgi:hypothetical protein